MKPLLSCSVETTSCREVSPSTPNPKITNDSPNTVCWASSGRIRISTLSLAVQDLLAAHPHPDQAADRRRGDRLHLPVARDDVPGIALGLQQAGHDVHVPDGDMRRLVLQADVLLVGLRQAGGVLLPPPLLL